VSIVSYTNYMLLYYNIYYIFITYLFIILLLACNIPESKRSSIFRRINCIYNREFKKIRVSP